MQSVHTMPFLLDIIYAANYFSESCLKYFSVQQSEVTNDTDTCSFHFPGDSYLIFRNDLNKKRDINE